jgi:phosphatidylserine synthase 2
MIELDAFFLKDLLWVPPESPLNIYRLFIWWILGVVAVRDYYAFIDNSDVKRCVGRCPCISFVFNLEPVGFCLGRFGACAWIAVGALILEFLIVFKFAVLKYTDMAMPGWVKLFWVVFGTIFVAASGWWFLVGRFQFKPQWHKE